MGLNGSEIQIFMSPMNQRLRGNSMRFNDIIRDILTTTNYSLAAWQLLNSIRFRSTRGH